MGGRAPAKMPDVRPSAAGRGVGVYRSRGSKLWHALEEAQFAFAKHIRLLRTPLLLKTW